MERKKARKKLILPAALAVTVIALTGCGDKDKPAPDAAPPDAPLV
jgi:hypothetical protein